jgi:hypothetical protein
MAHSDLFNSTQYKNSRLQLLFRAIIYYVAWLSKYNRLLGSAEGRWERCGRESGAGNSADSGRKSHWREEAKEKKDRRSFFFSQKKKGGSICFFFLDRTRNFLLATGCWRWDVAPVLILSSSTYIRFPFIFRPVSMSPPLFVVVVVVVHFLFVFFFRLRETAPNTNKLFYFVTC